MVGESFFAKTGGESNSGIICVMSVYEVEEMRSSPTAMNVSAIIVSSISITSPSIKFGPLMLNYTIRPHI